jgi:hypothetical protein
MSNRGLKIFFIIFFCLSSSFFYYPVWIPVSFLYYIFYAVFFITFLLIIINFGKYRSNVFTTPVLMLIIAMFISAFSATLFWSQSLRDSFIAIFTNLSYIIFFLLIIFKLRVRDIQNIIFFLGAFYIIIFSITYISYPIITFGPEYSDLGSDRGFQRILLPGVSYLFVLSFYSLNQYFNKRNLGWLIVYFITIISIIMTLTRTMIMLSFIFSTWYILRKSNYFYKIFAVLFIGSFVYLITKMNFSQILFEQTLLHIDNLNDYIRVRAADFYIHDFSPNIFAKIFGNGQPLGGSGYAFYVRTIEITQGYYMGDVGIVGLYTKFGILAVLAFIILIYKTIKISIPEEYLYCKYSLYFIFITTIIGDAIYNSAAIPSILLPLYILSSIDLSRSNVDVTL